MKILVIDAFDSFVHLINSYLLSLGCETLIIRNNVITFERIDAFSPDAILLGPGPGHPAEARYVDIIHHYKGKKPILGVCLGHQAIGLAFGGEVSQASHLMHGKTSSMDHDGNGVFKGIGPDFRATRYHSLIVSDENFPHGELEVTCRSRDDHYIMGIRHKSLPIESIQFHPESISTQSGIQIFRNFIDAHRKRQIEAP